MKTDSDNNGQTDDAVVCPKCLLANSPSAAFCADCGAPIGMVSTIDPIQHIQAEGFAYRSAVEGPPKLIILIGMWLLFAPMVFVAPFFAFGVSDDFLPRLFFTALAVCSVVVLFRTTKNYFVKSRLANDRNA